MPQSPDLRLLLAREKLLIQPSEIRKEDKKFSGSCSYETKVEENGKESEMASEGLQSFFSSCLGEVVN